MSILTFNIHCVLLYDTSSFMCVVSMVYDLSIVLLVGMPSILVLLSVLMKRMSVFMLIVQVMLAGQAWCTSTSNVSASLPV